jgi:hypothetical protein
MTDPITPDTSLASLQGEEPNPKGEERSKGKFGTLTPREASLRAVEKRRELAAQRAAASELDALTVHGRISTALARRLTFEQLLSIVSALAEQAAQGKPQAARELREWVKLTRGDDDDGTPDDSDPSTWSKERRAAARATILRAMQEEDPANEDIP